MKKYYFLLFIMLSGVYLEAQQEKHARVKIFMDKKDFHSYTDLGMECDHGAWADQTTYVSTLSERDLDKLKQSNFSYEILIEDERAYFLKHNKNADFYASENGQVMRGLNGDTPCSPYADGITTPNAFTPGSMGGYYTLAEMEAKIDEMIATYPNLISVKTNIGNSIEGRPVHVVVISDNPNMEEGEPEILYTSLHHAREPNSMMQLIFYMQYLLENYNSDDEIKALVDSRAMYFIPCLNPDGYEYNYQTDPMGGGFFRKNRRLNAGGSYGVDLNRNYPEGWGDNDSGSSPNEASATYRGTAGFSEPETANLGAFVNTRNFKIALNNHSYGNLVIRPLGYASAPALPPNELSSLREVGHTATKHNCYLVGNTIETVGYPVNGSSDDWFYAGDLSIRPSVFSYTPETGTWSDGFWPLQDRIIPIAKNNLFSNLQMAYMAGTYTKFNDTSDPIISSTTGNLSFEVQRLGLTDGPITVRLLVDGEVQNVGNEVTISSGTLLHLGYGQGTISYTLDPSLIDQNVVDFTWEIECGGTTYQTTSQKFFNPIVVFEDDMEGNITDHWISNSSWLFEPEPNSFTNNVLSDALNNYTSDAMETVILNEPLDFSDATEAFLMFKTKYESQPCHDRLQVEILDDQLSTFVPLCSALNITENAQDLGGLSAITGNEKKWTNAVFDLSPYISQPNPVIQFTFYSDEWIESDGFLIDDVRIIKNTDNPSTGITETAIKGLGFSVQPNPTHGQSVLVIDAENAHEGQLSIRDYSGKIIMDSTLSIPSGIKHHNLSIDQLSAGFYFIHFVSEDGTAQTSFVKM